MTETSEPAPLPTRSSARVSASSSAARVVASSPAPAPALDELNEPVVALRSVPEVALDLLEERRREPAEPLLGPELEHAVRLEPGLLGLLPVARGRRRLQAVERRRDDVEVGRLRCFLPFRRVERAR